MRFQWIVFILSILISMGLTVVIMGQNHVMNVLKKASENVLIELERVDKPLRNDVAFQSWLENLVAQGTKKVAELEGEVTKLRPEMEKIKTVKDTCEAEKKTKADELAGMEKERTETETTLKAESEAWKKEINTLKPQLTEYRPICDHVKNATIALNMCGKGAKQMVDKQPKITAGPKPG